MRDLSPHERPGDRDGSLFKPTAGEGQRKVIACVHNGTYYAGHRDELILTVSRVD